MNLARTPRHWWLFAILVLAGQLAFIFWLSDDRPPGVHHPLPTPALHLAASSSNELFALNDPTLFALPHAQGFSGKAWQIRQPVPTRSFEWSSELEWLPLPVSQLGRGLAKFVQTNQGDSVSRLVAPDLQVVEPEPFADSRFPQRSFVRIEGSLRQRKLLTPLEPPSWPSADLLTNTLVELLVGEDGRPVSWKRLPPGSGSVEADQQALVIARSARFESVVPSGPGHQNTGAGITNLVTGRLVFIWHTIPKTNG